MAMRDLTPAQGRVLAVLVEKQAARGETGQGANGHVP
jgi:hypothetical protein